jgi:hypothetical protein
MRVQLTSVVVLLLGCSPPSSSLDGGPPPVDAGQPWVVDGGLVGPFSRGALVISQTVREEGIRTIASSVFTAFLTQVPARTSNPCVERTEGACKVRICNQGERIEGASVSPGSLTLVGLRPLEVDAGPVDAGSGGGGVRVTLWPNDAGIVSFAAPQRLFFGGDELVVQGHGDGDGVPAFVSPVLVTPAQLRVSTPRCTATCPTIARDQPFRVAWANVLGADIIVQLNTRQVSVTCEAPAEQAALIMPEALLSQLTPSLTPQDATLVVLARRSVQFDAGSWNLTFSAETPTLLPITVTP